jgi:hypothetical protein
LVKVFHLNRGLVMSSGNQGSFIAHIGDISTAEAY